MLFYFPKLTNIKINSSEYFFYFTLWVAIRRNVNHLLWCFSWLCETFINSNVVRLVLSCLLPATMLCVECLMFLENRSRKKKKRESEREYEFSSNFRYMCVKCSELRKFIFTLIYKLRWLYHSFSCFCLCVMNQWCSVTNKRINDGKWFREQEREKEA